MRFGIYPLFLLIAQLLEAAQNLPLLTLLTWLRFFKGRVKWLCLFELLNFLG